MHPYKFTKVQALKQEDFGSIWTASLSKDMFDIYDKVAIISGGASGIGLETAKQLLINGAKGVVLADINTKAGKAAVDRLGDEFGREKVIFAETDVSNKQSFEDAFKSALTTFGNIDILVNNAGIPDERNYEKLIAVNLTGTTHGTLLAHEEYILNHKSGPEGVIINTASTAGCHVSPVRRFLYGSPIYGATKSGIISLTIGLGDAVHYEKTKIKVLAIAPGMTLTNIGVNFKPRSFFHAKLMMKESVKGVLQSAEVVGKAIVEIIKNKPSGTVWICENNQKIYQYNPSNAD